MFLPSEVTENVIEMDDGERQEENVEEFPGPASSFTQLLQDDLPPADAFHLVNVSEPSSSSTAQDTMALATVNPNQYRY